MIRKAHPLALALVMLSMSCGGSDTESAPESPESSGDEVGKSCGNGVCSGKETC